MGFYCFLLFWIVPIVLIIYFLKEFNDRLRGLHKCSMDTYLTADYIRWLLRSKLDEIIEGVKK